MLDLAAWPWPLLLSVSVVIAGAWAGLFGVVGNNAVALPFVLPALAGTVTVLWQAALRRQWALLTLLVLWICLLGISFRTREKGEVGLDWQNGLKILSWAGMAVIAGLNAGRLVRIFADPPLLIFGCYGLICLVSTAVSAVPLITATSAFGVMAYMLFGCLLVDAVPADRLLRCLLWTLTGFCIINLLSAVVVPDMAYMQVDPVNHPETLRFQGLSGHPNQLGRITSMFAMLVIAAAHGGLVRRAVWASMAALALGTILFTQSRTALLSVVLAYGCQMPRRLLVPIVATVGLCAASIVFSGQDEALLGLIGRGGDVNEAMSLSGRTDLWNFAWSLIVERPLTGYGYNSFEAYAGTLWTGEAYAAVVATHNTYLSVLFCTGLLGLIPFLLGFGLLSARWITTPSLLRDMFTINAIFYGFTEADVPSIAVVPTTMMFIILALDADRRAPVWLSIRTPNQ